MPFESMKHFWQISMNVTCLMSREDFPWDKRPCSMSIWSPILNSRSGITKIIIALKSNQIINKKTKEKCPNLGLL